MQPGSCQESGIELSPTHSSLTLRIPTIEHAEAILGEAAALNPGAWVAHSQQVARAARSLAEPHPALNADTAWVLGLLHDIGRRAGPSGMRHGVDGFRFLDQAGFPDAARICITHSYPNKDAAEGSAEWDGTEEEFQFIQSYLDRIEYTDYDRLIQLCDSICLPEGFCLMEKRLVDVVTRYGFNAYTLPKWRAFFEIKTRFERAIGSSIYELLPGVVEITFQG